MSRQRVLMITIVGVAVLIGLNVARGLFWLPTIPVSYQGDGRFEDLSRRAGPFAIPGYAISMPTFDLGKPFQAEYRLAGLPNIGRDCGVHLGVHDPDHRWGDTQHLGGHLRISLLDDNGGVVVSVGGRLGEYTWMGWLDRHALWQNGRSFFRPDPAKEYRLLFTYEPDAALAGYTGYAYVRSGGHK